MWPGQRASHAARQYGGRDMQGPPTHGYRTWPGRRRGMPRSGLLSNPCSSWLRLLLWPLTRRKAIRFSITYTQDRSPSDASSPSRQAQRDRESNSIAVTIHRPAPMSVTPAAVPPKKPLSKRAITLPRGRVVINHAKRQDGKRGTNPLPPPCRPVMFPCRSPRTRVEATGRAGRLPTLPCRPSRPWRGGWRRLRPGRNGGRTWA